MKSNKFNLGYFLKPYHIEKGFQLLKKQIEEKSYNFRSLDLQIYRNEVRLSEFVAQDFYNDYIIKDQFYNYYDLFYNLNYLIPKGPFGTREFNFTSFHLNIIYYSLGFYFLELTKSITEEYEALKDFKRNFNTYYGGFINFNEPNNSKIFYQDDYKNFIKGINKTVEKNITNNKLIVIKLDIQDFYSSINHETLLSIIDAFSIPSERKKLNYDSNSISSIKEFLFFIMKKNVGIPLSAQNIISNFISNLYLLELDNFIKSIFITK